MKGQISSVKGSLLPQFFPICTRNSNLNFSRCRNRIFEFDIAALDLVFFEWSYSFPYAQIRFPLYLPPIRLGDIGETKVNRRTTLKGHIYARVWGKRRRKVALQVP